jgi:hypothetical protein
MQTSAGAHAASCTVGIRSFFLGVKMPGLGLTTHPYLVVIHGLLWLGGLIIHCDCSFT